MKSKLLVAVIVLAALLVEALLLARIWAQATSQDLGDRHIYTLMVVTDVLAAPFSAVSGVHPIGQTGVIDYTVLVAVEGYFVALVALLLVTGTLKAVVSSVLRHRPVKLPDFVKAQMSTTPPTRIWQPVPSRHRPGIRWYRTHVRPATLPHLGTLWSLRDLRDS